MAIKSERESNLELLRIVAMLMIILHHIIVHGFYQHLSNTAHLQYFNNWAFCWPNFSVKLLIPEAMVPFGKTANGIFLMISGYFLVERGNKVKLSGIAKKLLIQLGFACIALVTVSFLLCQIYPTEIMFGLPLGIEAFNQEWWFVGYYFLVVALGALVLNEKMCECSKQTYATVLIVLFAIFSFSWSGTLLNGIGDLRSLSAGIFCYLWGGFCRKYSPLKDVKTLSFLLLIVVLYGLIWISYCNAVQERIAYHIHVSPNETFIQPTRGGASPDYGIVPISLSIIIFELFRRIRIKPSAVINYVSAASFMVYLVHDNEYVRNYWQFKEDLAALLYESPVQFCIKIGVRALLTYAAGIVLYTVYRGLLRCIKRYSHIFIVGDSKADFTA